MKVCQVYSTPFWISVVLQVCWAFVRSIDRSIESLVWLVWGTVTVTATATVTVTVSDERP